MKNDNISDDSINDYDDNSSEDSGVGINEYDDPITTKFKWSSYLSIPSRLAISGKDDSGIFYIAPYDFISNMVTERNDIITIYKEIITTNKDIILKEFFYYYYEVKNEKEEKESDILNEINSLYKDEKNLEFKTFKMLSDSLESIGKLLNANIEKEKIFVDTIFRIQQPMVDVVSDPFKISKINYKSADVYMRGRIKTNGDFRNITNSDGMMLFDKFKLSKQILYVRYNSPQYGAVYKVYQDEFGQPINNNILNSHRDNNETEDVLYILVWLGDIDTEDIGNSAMNRFRLLKYELSKNSLLISEKKADESGTITKIGLILNKSLPDVIFDEINTDTISASFKLYDFTIENSSLLYTILNNETFYSYFYIEERGDAYPDKTRLDLHFHSLKFTNDPKFSNHSTLAFNFLHNKTGTKASEVWDMKKNNITNIVFNKNTPYLIINISRAKSKQSIEEFILIFTKILYLYEETKNNTQNLYNMLLSNSRMTQLRKHEKTIDVVKIDRIGIKENDKSKLDKLKSAAPGIFQKGYAKICQKNYAPTIILEGEVIEESSKTFERDGKIFQRQIMDFPRENPLKYACLTDTHPYPYLITNNLDNEVKYPLLPCCASIDHLSNPDDDYYSYMKGNTIQTRKSNIGGKTTTKFIHPNNLASIPKDINKLLSNYKENSGEFNRYGTYESPNSLLHCIHVAFKDAKYFSLKTETEREDYIQQYRKNMGNNIKSALLLKQELFDFTNEEIKNQLLDLKSFLDPLKYYRAVEEYYGINLYIFDMNTDSGNADLSIPRHKIFHVSPYRPRSSILILRYENMTNVELKYPHCDLIIENKTTSVFDETMTSFCYKIWKDKLSYYTWEFKNTKSDLAETELITRKQPFSIVDYEKLFLNHVESQGVDKYGKLRSLNLKYDDVKITVMISPSSPLNFKSSIDFYEVEIKQAVRILGTPTRKTINSKNEITGLWFKILDFIEGIYVPVKPIATSDFNNTPIGSNNPLNSKSIETPDRGQKLNRILHLIKEILYWLYEIDRSTRITNPELFYKDYVSILDRKVDSAEYYDFKNVSEILPYVTTVKKAIIAMEKSFPSLFKNSKMIMYNQEFAKRIYYLLSKYDQIRKFKSSNVPKKINSFYVNSEDFKSQNRVSIFMSKEKYINWLSNIDKKFSQTLIINSILPVKPPLSSKPYTYQHSDGKIYLLQSVERGEKNAALNVAYRWNIELINKLDLVDDFTTLPHIVYNISPTKSLIVAEDNSNSENVYLQIIAYYLFNNVVYVALLPML
jgi:hypothetical protein